MSEGVGSCVLLQALGQQQRDGERERERERESASDDGQLSLAPNLKMKFLSFVDCYS